MIDSRTSKNPKGDVSVYEPLLNTITVNFVFSGKDRTVLLHMVEKSCLISMVFFSVHDCIYGCSWHKQTNLNPKLFSKSLA